MIDINKCEFEESFEDNETGDTTYYFLYPKDFTEIEFYAEEEYGNVVCMTISISVQPDMDIYVQMSPTVDEGDALYDVDWRDLYENENYMFDDIIKLINEEK